jgi:hypothetical protein
MQLPAAAEFRASAVKINITPTNVQPLLGYGARNSTGVHDPLFHRIAALDDGGLQFFLVSTDIALISPSVFAPGARIVGSTCFCQTHVSLGFTPASLGGAPGSGL